MNENDELYKALNPYHQIIKLTLELEPGKHFKDNPTHEFT